MVPNTKDEAEKPVAQTLLDTTGVGTIIVVIFYLSPIVDSKVPRVSFSPIREQRLVGEYAGQKCLHVVEPSTPVVRPSITQGWRAMVHSSLLLRMPEEQRKAAALRAKDATTAVVPL